MKKLGVVPAAGLGSRWGGYPKFLLPCGDKEWLLDRTIRMFPAENSVVIYGDVTMVEVVSHLERCNLLSKVMLTKNKRMHLDFWGSILAALEFEADYYYFAMPDTYPDPAVFAEMEGGGICLGMHYTTTPERYGVMRNGVIVNKDAGEPGWAWGVLGWSREVRDLWMQAHLETYTQAINLAIQEVGHKTLPMVYYYDMASFEDYAKFIGRGR